MDAIVYVVLTLTLAGAAFGRLPWVAMNRATICLVGAVALVVLGAIPRGEAYAAIDLDTIVLLLAMMIINVNLRIAGFFAWTAGRVAGGRHAPIALLAILMIVAGGLSAVFLNDTIAIAMTPLVIEIVRARGLSAVPYLIGLAVAANVGSVATVIGNPQNMLIGMASDIPFLRFVEVLGPVALGGLGIAWAVLAVTFRAELRASEPATEIRQPVAVNRRLLLKSLAATLLMLTALVAGMAIPMAALLAASLLLVTRRLHPDRVFREIDWGLLVFFAALFVVTAAAERAGLSAAVLARVDPARLGDVAVLTGVSALLSNVVSNVPAVMLMKPMVAGLADPERAWLVLAMATTFAGNLTLLGSVANLIVAETARREGVTLGFGTYLRAGVPITLLTLLWGGWCLSRF